MSIRYSVVIPSHNRAHQLLLTLSSYAAQAYDKSKFEVIVVDDGSTDNTVNVVREFRAPFELKYVANETRQSAAVARNRGASMATTHTFKPMPMFNPVSRAGCFHRTILDRCGMLWM